LIKIEINELIIWCWCYSE